MIIEPNPAGIIRAIRPGRRECIAIVGGGGKTSTMFDLSSGLTGRTIATTTTKMGARQTGGLTVLTAPDDEAIAAALRIGPVLVRASVRDTKAIGVAPTECDRWFRNPSLCEHIVIEADGARTRPFKAPAPHEPVIPTSASIVISVIGADALGRVIADQCQRPLRVAALAGCAPYERLEPERAAAVLLHPRGGYRCVPPQARRVVLITKVPTADVDPMTAELVDRLVNALAPTLEVHTVGVRGQ